MTKQLLLSFIVLAFLFVACSKNEKQTRTIEQKQNEQRAFDYLDKELKK